MLITDTSPPTRFTIREQIMRNFVSVFEAAPVIAGDVSWGLVTRAQITKGNIEGVNYAIGIYDPSEKITEGMGHEMRRVNVVCEFHAKLMQGDDPAVYLNHCLGQVQSRVGKDIRRGGIALNTRELGSELDIDGAFAEYVSGVVVFDVSYRCRPNDPYTRV